MKKLHRDKDGRFAVKCFCYIDDKGYPRIGSGPMRGQRLHRIVAAAMKGRPLTEDEDVHHKDGNKLNFAPENLKVLGHKEHGCVSAKQHHYLNGIDVSLKSEWDEHFREANAESSGRSASA
jgi:hypothetical protein